MPDKDNNNHKNYNNKGHSNRLKKEDSDKTKDKDKPIAKLLIVDYDPDISHVLKISLLKNGFSVNTFTSPEEALQKFHSSSKDYSLMLSDIRMPGMSGIQLARSQAD